MFNTIFGFTSGVFIKCWANALGKKRLLYRKQTVLYNSVNLRILLISFILPSMGRFLVNDRTLESSSYWWHRWLYWL